MVMLRGTIRARWRWPVVRLHRLGLRLGRRPRGARPAAFAGRGRRARQPVRYSSFGALPAALLMAYGMRGIVRHCRQRCGRPGVLRLRDSEAAALHRGRRRPRVGGADVVRRGAVAGCRDVGGGRRSWPRSPARRRWHGADPVRRRRRAADDVAVPYQETPRVAVGWCARSGRFPSSRLVGYVAGNVAVALSVFFAAYIASGALSRRSRTRRNRGGGRLTI